MQRQQYLVRSRGNGGLQDFDAVQVLVLPVGDLQTDRASVAVKSLHLHLILVNRAAMGVLVGLAAEQAEERLVQHDEVEGFRGRLADGDSLNVTAEMRRGGDPCKRLTRDV